MPCIVPFLKGWTINNEWNLDDEQDLIELGIKLGIDQKKADKYVHFKNCKHALVECTSSAISKAIKQLEISMKTFLEKDKSVDFLILVVNKVGSRERRIWGVGKDNIIINKENKKPLILRFSEKSLNVLLFTIEQVRQTRRLQGV